MIQSFALRDCPELSEKAALWFSDKWGIPLAAYRESIADCVCRKTDVPQWYLLLDEGEIAGGAGVIENDFHARKDLAPNVCALYIEETYRGCGLARSLLDWIRGDMASLGVNTLYLITDHRNFYERCGWTFLTTVLCDEGETSRVYVAHTR